ncbi:RNA-binding protein 34 [Protopterus annectens]|uniref:RNA-binding protein 34 n=1 Tax=Protopterus annectens TaxID=7888 RepID=UPI001CF9CB72|nr:RNA-binding protein 34 [Protopterus annectens]
MKKKHDCKRRENGNNTVDSLADEYRIGQVSDTLFHNKTVTNKESSLTSLFSSSASDKQLAFVPVKKVNLSKRDQSENQKDVKSKVQNLDLNNLNKACKLNTKKQTTAGEKRVSDRECGLQNADDDELQETVHHKKKKADSPNALKKISKVDEAEPGTPQTKKQNWAVERIKNKRTVFVGNLPVSCNKQMLKSIFKEFGYIESMRFRSVARADPTMSRKQATIQRKSHPKRHNMNAYIVFKEESDAVKALQRNGMEITNGFHIRVDLASKDSSHDQKRSIFVGNLPYDMEEEVLWKHFSECGQVEAVRLIRDRSTGLGKGFGYVLFESTDDVFLALKLDSSEVMGRKIRVQRCVKKEKVKSTNSKRGTQGGSVSFKHKRQAINKTKGKHLFEGKMTKDEKTQNKGKLRRPTLGNHKVQFKKKTRERATTFGNVSAIHYKQKTVKGQNRQRSKGSKPEK